MVSDAFCNVEIRVCMFGWATRAGLANTLCCICAISSREAVQGRKYVRNSNIAV